MNAYYNKQTTSVSPNCDQPLEVFPIKLKLTHIEELLHQTISHETN